VRGSEETKVVTCYKEIGLIMIVSGGVASYQAIDNVSG